MLHIFLTILKIPLILLAILLLLVLLILLLLLFVPVRYRLTLKKDSALSASGKVHWLFHLVSVQAGFTDKKLNVSVRIFGFPLVGGARKEKARGADTDGGTAGKKPPQSVADGPPGKLEKTQDSLWEDAVRRDAVLPEEAPPGEKSAQELQGLEETFTEGQKPQGQEESFAEGQKPQGRKESFAEAQKPHDSKELSAEDREPQNQEKSSPEPQGQEETSAEAQKPQDQKETSVEEQEPQYQKETSTEAQKLQDQEESSAEAQETQGSRESSAEKWEIQGPEETFVEAQKPRRGKKSRVSLGERLRRLIDKIRNTLLGIQEKIRNIRQHIADFRAKLESLRNFWYDEHTRPALGHAKREIFYLLRHYLPGRAEGRLLIGLSDPAATGQALGLLSVAQVFTGTNIQVEADFERAVLESDLSIKGHVRLCHLLKAGLALLFDRHFRGAVGNLRKLRQS